ncbi:MAG: phosphoadenosine phosphosulfate reductase [Silicimonas sp.]|nr:phosphoadenosine phosphosulfate reductase [Silicimonas sp.]NND22823.1 phosphoadenosine phosphosulfate reductase [Silicimonas sp.]NNL36493.1 phosphoadenosine phosphosulfate reductase [Silicimonas sp.]NNL74608.1 phosphoadenosine phosphosulfate reductase [Silicimonas sp.]
MSDDLSDAEWLKRLRGIGEKDGYFSTLGSDHASIFVERSHDVLFVALETLFGIRSVSDTGLPVAFDVCGQRGWSHLSLITQEQTWFRDKRVWNYFDRLVDYGFFEDFDRVIFYGAGMCGYAAAAFSVVAPGAQVILVSPQATLKRDLTRWDSRFPTARRLDFSTRYAYAPEMLEAASQAFIIYDPDETEDAMHAALFQGDNIHHHRYRRGRAGAIESDLRALGLVSTLAEKAANGLLTPARLADTLRLRKRHVPYLRALLARVLAEDRPALTAMLCRAVLQDRPIPRFKHHLEVAERRLAALQGEETGRQVEAQDTA